MESIERDAQARQVGDQSQDTLDQIAKRRAAGQVGAPACQIDPGQHHLVEAARDQPGDLLDHDTGRHAARIAPAIGMMQKVQRWSQPFWTWT